MHTDFYFTNLTRCKKTPNIVFFQNTSFKTLSVNDVFVCIKNCPFNWSYKTRILWDLSFRLKKKSGNLTTVYNLKTVYHKQRPFFLIYKEGSTFIQQDFKNGNQVILFKQIKGNEFTAIQIYRGDLLIKEQLFNTSEICFQIDTNINILYTELTNKKTHNHENNISLSIDFINLKSVHLKLLGTKNKGYKLVIDTIKEW